MNGHAADARDARAAAADAPDLRSASPALLHCTLCEGGFHLWAEAGRDAWPQAGSDADPLAWAYSQGEPTLYHPGALDAGDLWLRLHAAPLVPLARAGAGRPSADPLLPTEAGLLLPSAGARPLPSPLAGGDASSPRPLAWFLVPGCLLPMERAHSWLHPFAPPAGAGLGLASEWQFWWRAAAWVRSMVARGTYVPSLVWRYEPRLQPAWTPAYRGVDREAYHALQRAMPRPAAVPERSGGWGLSAFVAEYGESVVRSALRRHRPLRPYWSAARGDADPVRHWLAALLAPHARPMPRDIGRRGRIREWLADPAGVAGPGTLVLQVGDADADAPDAWPVRVHFERPADPGVLLSPAAVLAAAGLAAAPFEAQRDARNLVEALGRAESLLPELRRIRPQPAAAEPPGPPALADLLPEATDGVPWAEPAAAADLPLQTPAVAGAEAAGPAAAADGSEAAPAEVLSLNAARAWALLTAAPPQLKAARVRVLVPTWWRPPKLRAQLRLRSAGRGLLGTETLLRYDWRVTIGDHTLSVEEFEHLVAQRAPFVRLHGEWVALPPGAAAEVAAHWKAAGAQGEMRAGAALAMALRQAGGGEAGGTGHGAAVVVDGDEWFAAALAAVSAAPAEAAEPAGFRGTLRPYQRRGLAWLASRAEFGLGAILADDMGLGKTVQVLALLAHRVEHGLGRGPALVVAPTSVVANWVAEARRFAPALAVVVHQGASRARGADFAAAVAAAHAVVTSYPLLARDAPAFADVEWDGVMLDEAQYVKNAAAKQSQAARRLRARYRLALTGTPVENALSDLWSIFAFIQPGYLGAEAAFQRELAGPIERGLAQPGPADGAGQPRETLRRLIAPFVLRRCKTDPGVADELPPRIETVERCLLTAEQAALYEAVTRQLLARVAQATGLRRKAEVLTALLRLKQICNHPAHYAGDGSALEQRSGKLDRLLELLEEVWAEGERALVFTQFATWGRRMADHLREAVAPRIPVLCLDGGTPPAARADVVVRFQGCDGPAVLILSLRAGGAGLNLTAAQHVFHYDRWWNPAVERQATDRAHRIGQRATVHVHRLVCAGTVEEQIDRLIRNKEALAKGVLAAAGGGEAWITEMGDAELRDLLSLRRSALA